MLNSKTGATRNHVSHYMHLRELAPTQAMLDDYKKNRGSCSAYEREFLELLATRKVEKTVPRQLIEDGCLLCSEDKPHQCHRRLVAEYLKEQWGGGEIVHL